MFPKSHQRKSCRNVFKKIEQLGAIKTKIKWKWKRTASIGFQQQQQKKLMESQISDKFKNYSFGQRSFLVSSFFRCDACGQSGAMSFFRSSLPRLPEPEVNVTLDGSTFLNCNIGRLVLAEMFFVLTITRQATSGISSLAAFNLL